VIPVPNLGPKTGYPDWGFSLITTSLLSAL
jgi:hypothetical protein